MRNYYDVIAVALYDSTNWDLTPPCRNVMLAIPDDRPVCIKAVTTRQRRGLMTKNKDHKIAWEMLFHLRLETSESVEYMPCTFNFSSMEICM